MKTIFKIAGSMLAVTFFSILAVGSADDKKSSDVDSTSVRKVGETLSTDYFDVTVNEVGVFDRIATGNEFADLPRQEGIKYLVLTTTFKNTSNESRMLMDGEVLINYNGKDYNYDKSETIMLEGWGLMLDQLNPLTAKKTNLVYKLPSELVGKAYYRPGRSDGDQMIDLGEIK
ncbi:DUF4352 domain-containing protein [Flavobacterium sp.]|uniref:DUF4352 domain-containing protein n=1 Tax=Flavobacterium sp. TaxID=239 RepID=UPI001207DB3F|nr:DUF4352 domain-containing protein [Flavobacterium sp.]RZJ70238.1 MAG: DUF4352 domain-containing protein [Flavobacterium sp.]